MGVKRILKRVKIDDLWYDVSEGWAGKLNLRWGSGSDIREFTAKEPYIHMSDFYFVYDKNENKVGEIDINNKSRSGSVSDFEIAEVESASSPSSSSSSDYSGNPPEYKDSIDNGDSFGSDFVEIDGNYYTKEFYQAVQGLVSTIYGGNLQGGTREADERAQIVANLAKVYSRNLQGGTPVPKASAAPATHGRLTFSNAVYEGGIVNGKPNGKGKQTENDGTVAEGYFINGVLYGKGKITLSNGDFVEGDFVDGDLHGKGKWTWVNGDSYEGGLADGRMHGKGKATYAIGNSYEGDWVDGIREGNGKYTWVNGDVYEGDYSKDNINGKGKLTFKGGGSYEGDFLDGKFHGKGKMTYPNGRVEEGNWYGDKFLGKY